MTNPFLGRYQLRGIQVWRGALIQGGDRIGRARTPGPAVLCPDLFEDPPASTGYQRQPAIEEEYARMLTVAARQNSTLS